MARTASITKQFRFEAAHQLEHHDGKCARLHGHSYKLEITVTGEVMQQGPHFRWSADMSRLWPYQDPKQGFVMDFGDLSKIVKDSVVDRLDHQYLNDLFPAIYPSAENLAHLIWAILDPLMPMGVDLEFVELWETDSGSVLVAQSDRE